MDLITCGFKPRGFKPRGFTEQTLQTFGSDRVVVKDVKGIPMDGLHVDQIDQNLFDLRGVGDARYEERVLGKINHVYK